MSVVVIKRPRAVIRETLSDPLMRAKFTPGELSYIDAVLTKENENWSKGEFRKMNQFFGDCDD